MCNINEMITVMCAVSGLLYKYSNGFMNWKEIVPVFDVE